MNEPEKVERTERIEVLVDAQVLHALQEGYQLLHPAKPKQITVESTRIEEGK